MFTSTKLAVSAIKVPFPPRQAPKDKAQPDRVEIKRSDEAISVTRLPRGALN